MQTKELDSTQQFAVFATVFLVIKYIQMFKTKSQQQ